MFKYLRTLENPLTVTSTNHLIKRNISMKYLTRTYSTFLAFFLVISQSGCKAQQSQQPISRPIQSSKGGNASELFSEVVNRNLPAVVKIVGFTTIDKIRDLMGEYIVIADKKILSSGSGFIASEDGKIITANHVVAPIIGDIIVITHLGDNIVQHKAKILAIDSNSDIAVLKIEGGKYPYLELLDPVDLSLGEEVGFIGYPQFVDFPIEIPVPFVSKCVLSSKVDAPIHKGLQPRHLLVINSFVNQGNSGGPLFHVRTGRVIGIVNSRRGVSVEDRKIKLPKDYSPVIRIGGVDPVALSIETYNMNLDYIGEVTQLGVGFCASIEYGQALLKK